MLDEKITFDKFIRWVLIAALQCTFKFFHRLDFRLFTQSCGEFCTTQNESQSESFGSHHHNAARCSDYYRGDVHHYSANG